MLEWIIDTKKTTNLWLEVMYCDVEVDDDVPGPPHFKAFVKWDGCLEVWEAEDSDWKRATHICSINDHIRMLMKLRVLARKHFGKDWPA